MSEELQTDYSDKIELPKNLVEEIENVTREYRLNKEQKKKLENEVKKRFIQERVEPGEVVGIIAAQSISEPATQMSLPYEEKILIKKDGIIFPSEIGRFVDELMHKFGSKIEGDSEILDLKENVNCYVYSLGRDEKLKQKRIKSVIRHKSPEKLLQIKTASGRKIIATDHHSFVIRKGNRIIPIAGNSLKLNDRIPVIKNLPENCISTISIDSVIKSENLMKKEGYIYPYVAHSKGLPNELKLDSLLGWLMGAYLSEGNSTKFFVNISNTNEEFNKLARSFANKFNLTVNEYDNFRGFSKGHDLRINSTLLSKFLKEICRSNSKNKKIPDFAYSSDEKFVSGLLRGYFDGDGNVSVSGKMIRVHSNSEELIDGTKLLLTRFGIFSYKCKEKKQFYLLIPYKYAPIFLEKIGSDIEEKRKRLEELAALAENFWEKKSQDFNDMIGGFGNIFYQIAKKLKYPTRCVNNFTKRQKIGRTALYRYIKLFERLSKEKNVDIEKELEILRQMFNSDVIWDGVIDISYVKPSSEYVYDVSVDGLETFTTFDGIITHNTMRTYHFAGSAGIKVTYGLPRLIEIFDAKKELETPVMTIYLKKMYNNKDTAKNVARGVIEKKVMSVSKRIMLNLNENCIEIEPFDARSLEKIFKILEEGFKDIQIKEKAKKIAIAPKSETDIKMLEKLKEKIVQTHVSGIKGITNAVVRKEGEDWIINTVGSNLEKVLNIKEVDEARTITNDIYEVAKILGIEAARNVIMNESADTMQTQGLDIDIRHIMLVSDLMTSTGEIRSIGRYGVAGTKSSILARAAFEETIKHLVRASVRNESDNLQGIFENVMIGQVIPSGTGMFDLIAKFESEEK